MKTRLVEDHLGRIVRIEIDQQKHKHVPYIGRITGYDRDFIELDSYAIKDVSTVLSLSVEDIQKHEDKGTNLEILLKKDIIASLIRIKIEE